MNEAHRLTGSTVALTIVLLAAAVLNAQGAPQGEGTVVSQGLDIYQLQSEIKEGNEAQWVVRLDKRPTKTGTEGYQPSISAPTTWEPRVEFFWNFGDDTGWISTGERPSITHRYMEAAYYLLQVEARSDAGTVSAELQVEVVDRDYYGRLIKAIEIDPADGTYELTADVVNPSEEPLMFHWDFGDGDTWEGPDLWRLKHRFEPGVARDVTVRWVGDDGTEAERTVQIEKPLDPGDDELDQFDKEVVAEGVDSRFEGEFVGDLGQGEIRAEVRPWAGGFLGGENCQFMLSAWDPELLSFIVLITHVPNAPEEGGRYRVAPSAIGLIAEGSAEAYEGTYNSVTGLAERLEGILGKVEEKGLTGEVNKKLRQTPAGIQLGPRENQRYAGFPASGSPLVSEPSEGYKGVSGSIDLLFVPHQRAVGIVNVQMKGGRGDSKNLILNGRFVLDLKSAPRDGFVMYRGCVDEPTFEIERTYGPEPGERHIMLRRPRVGVKFSSDVDPETLNDSSFGLAYMDRFGNLVPVETRLYRAHDNAFLRPEQDLWGGVQYVAYVKVGDEGVRGLNGLTLEDNFWGMHFWTFWTRLDFEPDAGSGELESLSCHVYQVVRDAPLIPGRHSVARVFADWSENLLVDPDSQFSGLPARVVLGGGGAEIARTEHTFLRPDLLEGPRDLTQHTANLEFVPDHSTPPTLWVRLEVNRGTEEDTWWPYYYTHCSTPVWEHEPELNVEIKLLQDSWVPPPELGRRVVESQDLPVEVGMFNRLPLRHVSVSYGGELDVAHDSNQWRFAAQPQVPGEFLDALEDYAVTESSADIVIGVDPSPPLAYEHPVTATRGFDVTYPATIYVWHPVVDTDQPGAQDDRPSLETVILHQIGHVLGLEDVPDTALQHGPPAHPHSAELAEEIQLHDGFAGIWWQGEGMFDIPAFARVSPMMHPDNSGYWDASNFILRHHYLAIQERIDGGMGVPNLDQ